MRDWTRVPRKRERLKVVHKDMSTERNKNKNNRTMYERKL